eukprot:m.38124 g.38124  ORF g.38124 m.38124 type:complete len:245 (-) comp5615_c0_seq2:1079-1813(-)
MASAGSGDDDGPTGTSAPLSTDAGTSAEEQRKATQEVETGRGDDGEADVQLHADDDGLDDGLDDEADEPRRPRDTSERRPSERDEGKGGGGRTIGRDAKRKRYSEDDGHGAEVKRVAERIDREKRCPFLLRVFVRTNGPLRVVDFADPARLPEDELQVYTWLDATLAELASLVLEVEAAPRRARAVLRFATVFRPQTGRGDPVLRELGRLTVGDTGPDDTKALRDTRFRIGDMLAVTVSFPRRG